MGWESGGWGGDVRGIGEGGTGRGEGGNKPAEGGRPPSISPSSRSSADEIHPLATNHPDH